MIITVTLNPALDKSVEIPGLLINEVNRAISVRIDAGGKGINVSKALRQLGSDTIATGFLGGSAGGVIREALDRDGIQNAFVMVPGQTRTNLKVFDPENRTYTDINEPGEPVPPDALDALYERIDSLASPGDTVLFAGSSPAGVDDDLPARWASCLQKRDVRIAADLDGPRLAAMVAAKPSLIKPNARELFEVLGLPDITPGTLATAARTLVGKGVELVVVSMGAQGALFADQDGVWLAAGPAVDAVSTVGAGDMLMAGLLHGLARGDGRLEMIRFAMAAATAKVLCPGSSPPSMEEVQRFIPQIVIEAFGRERLE